MKKIFAFFLLLGLLCVLCACPMNEPPVLPTGEIVYRPSRMVVRVKGEGNAAFISTETAYKYDGSGRLLSEDDGLTLTTHHYDEEGKLIKSVLSSYGMPDREHTYIYNTQGKLLQKTADGLTTTYEYDSRGFVVRELCGVEEITYRYEGDLLKEKKRVVGGAEETTVYTYSLTGVPLTAMMTYVSRQGHTTTGITTYVHDEDGNMLESATEIISPGGEGFLPPEERIVEYYDYIAYEVSE